MPWDDIDRWYDDDRFAEPLTIGGVPGVRGIVSRVDTTEPVEPAGMRTAQTTRVRVRVSEVAERPAARTIVTTNIGERYRIAAAGLGSTRKEWILDCIQEASAAT